MDTTHVEFKKSLLEWDTLLAAIKEAQNALKVLRQKKIELQKVNITHMKKYEVDVCNLKNGKIFLRKYKQKKTPPKSAIPETIKKFFMQHKDYSDAEATNLMKEITHFINNEVEYVDKYTLRRSFTRSNT